MIVKGELEVETAIDSILRTTFSYSVIIIFFKSKGGS